MGLEWYVTRVVVRDPAQRGRGLGERMVKRLLEAIRRQGPAVVLVEPGGYAADLERQRAFYAKCGFQPVSGSNIMRIELP